MQVSNYIPKLWTSLNSRTRADLLTTGIKEPNAYFDISGNDLSHKDLDRLDLSEGLLRKVKFNYSNINNCNFRGSDLQGSSLFNAKVNGEFNVNDKNTYHLGSFRGTDLTNSDLRDAQFYMLDFSGANFRNANLTDSSFVKCKFRTESSVFKGTILGGVKLVDCDLTEVRPLDLQQLLYSGARFKDCKFPAYFNPTNFTNN